jgi:hypothetical protein
MKIADLPQTMELPGDFLSNNLEQSGQFMDLA